MSDSSLPMPDYVSHLGIESLHYVFHIGRAVSRREQPLAFPLLSWYATRRFCVMAITPTRKYFATPAPVQ
jgi:hypothetical protein